MQKIPFLCGLAATVLIQSPAQAGVSFYVGNQAGFDAVSSSLEFKGLEDWESSTLGGGLIAFLDDPLAPNVAKGTFPTGSNGAAGITVQSNTGGVNSANPLPRGANGLATNSAGFVGAPSDQVGANNFGDGFDMIFNPSGNNTSAVGLNPLYFHASATTSTSHNGNLTISVYNDANVLLGSQTMTGVDYSAAAFLGIVATDGSNIRRVNIASTTDSNNSVTGADNIRVFAIPEPAVVSFTLLGLAGLLRRRR